MKRIPDSTLQKIKERCVSNIKSNGGRLHHSVSLEFAIQCSPEALIPLVEEIMGLRRIIEILTNEKQTKGKV